MVQDVEPLKPVRAQLASAAKSPEEAFRKMKNKTFVVETKFDGQSSSSLSVLCLCCQDYLPKIGRTHSICRSCWCLSNTVQLMGLHCMCATLPYRKSA